jgi:hypothetical protein
MAGTNREIPKWLKHLPINNGDTFHFIMRRSLTASDVNNNRNRLNIPTVDVRNHLIPLLHNHEREGSIEVTLYTRGMWWFKSSLTRYQINGQTVIMGDEYSTCAVICGFKEGEVVTLWAFRSGEKLCFAIDNVTL